MTISVNITRQQDCKDYDLKVIRKTTTKISKDGEPEQFNITEAEVQILKPGETAFNVTLWDNAEITLKEA